MNGKYKIPVTVFPLHYLYDDPVCKWGCNMNYVKSHQKQGTINSKSDDSLLIYDNAGGTSLMGYTFENGKLKSVIVLVSTNHMSSLIDYLTERYVIVPYYQGSKTYYIGFDALTKDEANTAIVVEVYSASQISVIYTPAN